MMSRTMREALDISAYLVVGPENTEGRPVREIVRAALHAGFTCVQIRSKEASAREMIELLREAAEEIAAALSQLPQEQRDILVLRFYRGWTLARIAQETGLTYDTVVSRQKSAFEKLRKILKERIE
ncbi:MAG: sigma-70 family RNA polymerase sigma factor [Schwartzia sp.]|nr:sigma-70 family RNA polymerase sigma factor [Schwartzia sp. (in: firmicutes)]